VRKKHGNPPGKEKGTGPLIDTAVFGHTNMINK
jgi:hypothetical protein